MKGLSEYEVWFVTGSQHLYGETTLREVDIHSEKIVEYLNSHSAIMVKVVFKPVVKTPEEILQVCDAANNTPNCVGIITWMHTFSPAKMWIRGLNILNLPILHLHTQFNRDIPFSTIDMDFMNLNQSAHGDREFGHIMSKMKLNRKVVVGHWQDEKVIEKINIWTRVAAGSYVMKHQKVVRFGDNMRQVAVTDGDKVSAEMKFGFSVNTHGVGDLVDVINQVSDSQIKQLVEAAIAAQCLPQRFAADDCVAHHRPAAYRHAPRGITQCFILHCEHGAHLQICESFHRDTGFVLEQQSRRDTVFTQ